MYVLNTIAPIFLIVLLGAGLRRFAFASADFFRNANRLVYWVGLPLLIFGKTATAPVGAAETLRISLVLVAGIAACTAVACIAGRLLRLPGPSLGAFIQGAYRGNLLYVGLPIALYALAGAGVVTDEATEARAIVALAPIVPLNNILAVIVLVLGQPRDGARLAGKMGTLVFNVFTNPLLLATVAGLLFAASGLSLPLAIDRTCDAVGRMSLPLALLALGASLTFRSVRSVLVPASVAAVIKVGIGPLTGYLVGRALGLPPHDLRTAMLYLACPTAVVSFLMAEQLGCDGRLASAIVVLTTLFSIVSFAIVLAL